jgi:uncharacterized protein YecT (DUF1311 family)
MKTIKTAVIILIALCATIQSTAQITKKQIEVQVNNMDSASQACDDKGISFIDCGNTFYEQMDSMLNLVYKHLKKQLDTATFIQLKQEQLTWLSKRNKYFKEVDSDREGKELGVDASVGFTLNRKASFVEDRILFILKKWWRD